MDYKKIMESVWADIQKLMPEHLERLSWTPEQLREYQTKALRGILTFAKENTPFYQEVLSSVDTGNFKIEDLSKLPPTDKTLHMERWDDFVAAPGITYEIAEKHLERVRSGKLENPFYNDRYLFIATGGSTGKRGLFIWDTEFLKETVCLTYRYLIDSEQNAGYRGAMKLATVEAPTLLHGSQFLFPSKVLPEFELLRLTAIDPVSEQCEKLNDFKPTYLVGYPSSLIELAYAQLSGDLDIHPRWVSTNSGPLDQTMRARMKEAWGVKTCDSWGSVEIGSVACETMDSPGMVIGEDGVILELVDHSNNPVDEPKDAAKVLATCLFNKSLPMIRYEIDDVMDIGQGYAEYPAYKRIKNILGKATNWFLYGDTKVHPMAFSDILVTEKEVEEFQVVQTEQGAHIKLVCNGEPNIKEMKDTILKNLNKYGLHDPIVDFEVVDSLPHHPETGKVARFVRLQI